MTRNLSIFAVLAAIWAAAFLAIAWVISGLPPHDDRAVTEAWEGK